MYVRQLVNLVLFFQTNDATVKQAQQACGFSSVQSCHRTIHQLERIGCIEFKRYTRNFTAKGEPVVGARPAVYGWRRLK